MRVPALLVTLLSFALFFAVLPAQAATAPLVKNLSLGSSGAQVTALQKLLNEDPTTRITTTGAGSPGHETTYFGLLTKAAVMRLQQKYASSILAPAGLTKPNGFVGLYTRLILNSPSYSGSGGGTVTAAPSPKPTTLPTTVSGVSNTSGGVTTIPTPPVSVGGGGGGGGGSSGGGSSAPSPTPTNGQCGASNGATVSSAPSLNLCSAGSPSGVTGSGPWSWSCNGSNGGTNASCSANKTVALTVSTSGATIPSNTQLVDSQLNVWTVSNGIIYKNGTTTPSGNVILLLYLNGVIYQENNLLHWWSWVNNAWVLGSDPRVSAAVNGICGSSNGTSTSTAPSLNLCATGSASGVTGSGPWSWSCNGSNGGTNASCSASTTVLAQVYGITPQATLDAMLAADTAAGSKWPNVGNGSALDLSNYNLIWQDDFNTLDVTNPTGAGPWRADVMHLADTVAAAGSVPAAPAQTIGIDSRFPGIYTDANGVLSLAAKKINGTWYEGHMQTVDSKGAGFSCLNCYFEVRMKLPAATSTWPAFWVKGIDKWLDYQPNGGTGTHTTVELDMIEWYGITENNGGSIHGTMHLWAPPVPSDGRDASWHFQLSNYRTIRDSSNNPINLSNDYHLYGVLFTPTTIYTYLDRVQIGEVPRLAEYQQPLYPLLTNTMKQISTYPATDTELMIDSFAAYAPNAPVAVATPAPISHQGFVASVIIAAESIWSALIHFFTGGK